LDVVLWTAIGLDLWVQGSDPLCQLFVNSHTVASSNYPLSNKILLRQENQRSLGHCGGPSNSGVAGATDGYSCPQRICSLTIVPVFYTSEDILILTAPTNQKNFRDLNSAFRGIHNGPIQH